MKSTTFLSVALMTQYISKIMDMMDQLLAIRINYQNKKRTFVLVTVQKDFFSQDIKILFQFPLQSRKIKFVSDQRNFNEPNFNSVHQRNNLKSERCNKC